MFDDKIKDFWRWFVQHSQALYDSYDIESEIWLALGDKLDAIADGLTFEFNHNERNEPKKFIISADGRKELIEIVEKIYEAKPSMPGWEIIKFRPAIMGYDLKMDNGIEINFDETFYLFEREDSDKLSLLLFVKDYTDDREDEYFEAGVIFAQSFIGEYDFMSKINSLGVYGYDSEYFPCSYPASEMVSTLDQSKY